MVVHPFYFDVKPFILKLYHIENCFPIMVKTINCYRAFNQETEFGGQLARQIAESISNPVNVLARYRPETLRAARQFSYMIDFIKYLICSIVIALCVLRLLINIPEDIRMENEKRKFFSIQRRNDCYSEYEENQCNSTTSPELIKHCEMLKSCYKSIDENPKKVNFLSFEWELVNNFFFYLSRKSAAFLGFTFGCFVFYNLTH